MGDGLFFLFGGDYYYPFGGVADLVGVFPTVETALEAARGDIERPWNDAGETSVLQWWHIATIERGNLVIIHKGSGAAVTL